VGIGPGIAAQLLQAIPAGAGQAPRTRLATAEQCVLPLLRYLRQAQDLRRIEVTRSYRRRRETVGDIELGRYRLPNARPSNCRVHPREMR